MYSLCFHSFVYGYTVGKKVPHNKWKLIIFNLTLINKTCLASCAILQLYIHKGYPMDSMECEEGTPFIEKQFNDPSSLAGISKSE